MSAPGGPRFLAFPLRVGADGPARSERAAHVRELIEQLLFTSPGERVFRPEFGVGLRALVFEPADSALREVAAKRVRAGVAELLLGEVDPRSLEVDLAVEEERVQLRIGYQLAAIGERGEHVFTLGAADG